MQSVTLVRDSGNSTPSILGQARSGIPTCGRIRAGIRILTQAAAALPGARELYRAGVAAGHNFEQIEAALRAAFPALETPLRPKNVGFFVARPADFSNPALAGQLMDLYAEDRGDGVRRLYRFPVVFPADMWEAVMPHQMRCHGRGGQRFWSEYDSAGTRRCMCYAEPARDGAKVVRVWGGRRAVARPDNGGMCEPELCPQYQSRQCNLQGRFIFMVPGLRTLDALELPTGSYYAMSRAVEKFKAIAHLRGGRLSGFLDEHGATFYLSKQWRTVSRLDEHGNALRTEQWIIELDAETDITAMLRRREPAALLAAAEQAAHALGVDRFDPADDPADVAIVPEAAQDVDIDGAGDCADRPDALPRAQDGAPAQSAQDDPAPVDCALELLWAKVRALGAAPAQFAALADRRWGAGWRHSAHGRQAAERLVTSYGAAELARLLEDARPAPGPLESDEVEAGHA